ncbi:unnamed protein product [Pleuronectes platessa]|uniref:Uncharacterized protein n=1 Tax=Pleuronectes platessa TaxID=8262 RepID=A0A9N7U707_PLEPL|nr:unnamed protein product [Pleuronectes platessa]
MAAVAAGVGQLQLVSVLWSRSTAQTRVSGSSSLAGLWKMRVLSCNPRLLLLMLIANPEGDFISTEPLMFHRQASAERRGKLLKLFLKRLRTAPSSNVSSERPDQVSSLIWGRKGTSKGLGPNAEFTPHDFLSCDPESYRSQESRTVCEEDEEALSDDVTGLFILISNTTEEPSGTQLLRMRGDEPRLPGAADHTVQPLMDDRQHGLAKYEAWIHEGLGTSNRSDTESIMNWEMRGNKKGFRVLLTFDPDELHAPEPQNLRTSEPQTGRTQNQL